MSILFTAVVALASALTIGAGAAGAEVQPPNPDPPERAPVYQLTGARVAIGRDAHVAANEEVTEAVVVIGGSLRVDGRVRDGILVVGGDLHLGPTADVRGDIALVGGELTRDSGSRLIGSVSDVSFGEWGRLVDVRWWPVRDLGGLGRWLGLVATIARVSVLAVLMLAMLLVARGPVGRVGRTAAAEPVRAIVVGLAAEVLFLPLLLIFSILLGLTVIGLPFVALLVPAAFLTALAALLLGFTALACRLGEWVEARMGWTPHSAVMATVVGLLLIVGPTLAARVLDVVPVSLHTFAFALLAAGALAEFVIWTIGLGATLLTGFGRVNTIDA